MKRTTLNRTITALTATATAAVMGVATAGSASAAMWGSQSSVAPRSVNSAGATVIYSGLVRATEQYSAGSYDIWNLWADHTLQVPSGRLARASAVFHCTTNSAGNPVNYLLTSTALTGYVPAGKQTIKTMRQLNSSPSGTHRCRTVRARVSVYTYRTDRTRLTSSSIDRYITMGRLS